MINGKYRIGTVARMTGFSVDVLRVWERRYGFLEPGRGPGRQRLYTDEDLAVLLALRRELDQGRSIGEIALAGREALLESAATTTAAEPTAQRLDQVAGLIVEAAIAVDGERIQRLLDEVFAIFAVETVVSRVLEPAAREIGEAWAEGRCSVAGEHLATGLFTRRLSGIVQARSEKGTPERSRVICACFPDELHEFGALVVSYHLVRMGLRVTYLGANLPFEDLEAAIRAIRPHSVYLSVSRRAVIEAHRHGLLSLLARNSRDVAMVLGGRGVVDLDEALVRAGAIVWPDTRPAHEFRARLAGLGKDPST